ncbi:hypothetical protein [Streptomyces murinus]|uniref:Uncharacterized protein n=1 Tax=Streptomyces murinus TaxID=33900 RepID=A0A7W3NQ52_STRMR|nr:hypothetical protein [Streptomyces murinus]MBA9054665.1 hypothetical protein [Streptomyces murinus]
MNVNRTMGRWSAATVLPVALLAATVATNGATASAAPAPSEAAFVLDATTGSFVTGRTALASGGVHTVKAYTGKATDSEILAAGSQHVIADVTLAHSANRTERAAWAASTKFVDLSWPDLGATSYTVIRDGTVIARTSDHSLRDNTIVPGSEPSYQISGDAKGLGHTWGLNVTVPTGDTPTALAQTAQKVEVKAKKYTKTVVTWRSFIRQPWVTVPTYISKPSGCKYGGSSYKYKGDGRGYSSAVSGTSFRAGVRGVVYWTKSSYELFPETGWTKVYKKGKLVAKRKASTKKIDFRTKTRFDGKTRAVHGQVEATDPFCPKSGIRRAGIGVYYDARLARNGDFYVSGSARPAPDHEMYLFGYTSGSKHSTKTVYQHKMSTKVLSGLECLYSRVCEPSTISNNGGY